jgi:hypothetical protein
VRHRARSSSSFCGSSIRISNEQADIGRQLSELEKQRKQAHQRALRDSNWTENDRLQARITELMEHQDKLIKI